MEHNRKIDDAYCINKGICNSKKKIFVSTYLLYSQI